jgi:hypothetical protein
MVLRAAVVTEHDAAAGNAAGVPLMKKALALALCLPLMTAQAAEPEWIGAAELRQLITDSTVTGRYDNGEPYSEYHAADGRALGHNNREPNSEACWDIRSNTVCYYYATGRAKGEFCWRFQRLGEEGIRASLIDKGRREIIGIRQAGNPYGHTDNGKPWTCDPVTSERITPRDPATRYARR